MYMKSIGNGVILMKVKIITPENIEVEYSLANLGSRTAAFIIDSIIEGLILGVLLLILWLIQNYAPFFWQAFYGWIVGTFTVVWFFTYLGYFVFLEMNMNGKTIGKKIMKIRTIRNNGQGLTFKHSLIRNLFRIFLDLFGIGVILIFLNKEHKRLGDMVASTIVVLEEDKSQPIVLESLLESTTGNYNYYLTQEEQDLLREYHSRKGSLEDYQELSKRLRLYFAKKFDEQGVLEEWKDFINNL